MGSGDGLVASTLDIVEAPAPAVSLVGHKALRHHQRVRCAVRADPDDFAEKRRRERETALRQNAAHFRLGVHAGHDPANKLQHQLTADHD